MATIRGSGSSGSSGKQPGGIQLDAFGEPANPVESRPAAGKFRARTPASAEPAALSSLLLPVSQRLVTCRFALLDPARCVASPLNRRIQSLLTPVNGDIRSLMTSIREEGQREPVLARPVMVNGKPGHEIIYGTRRRYAVEQLLREDGCSLKLKAWVVDEIGDADARRLAVSENENRSSISPWEMAQYLKEQLQRSPDWTHETLAAAEGMNRSLVTRYLQLADLDEHFVSLLDAPSVLTLTGGLAVRALARKYPEKLPALLPAIASQGPVVDVNVLLKLLRAGLEAPSKRQRDQRAPIRNGAGAVRGQMVRHRTKQGCYKIDLTGLSDTQAERVRLAVEAALA